MLDERGRSAIEAAVAARDTGIILRIVAEANLAPQQHVALLLIADIIDETEIGES